MPIRFRCEHCQQLLGIARRKAGTEVQCPTCKQSVVVPMNDHVEGRPVAGTAGEVGGGKVGEVRVGHRSERVEHELVGPPSPLFERSDFEAHLHEVVGEKAAPPPLPPPAPLPASPPTTSDSQFPFPMFEPPQGIVISPTWATILTVLAILLLALSFSIGLLVGKNL